MSLKRSLRTKCQTDQLGPEIHWPQDKSEAMLDRSYKVAGLGIHSDTSGEDEGDIPENANTNTST